MNTTNNLFIINKIIKRDTWGRTKEAFVTIPSTQTDFVNNSVFNSRGLTRWLPKDPVKPIWKGDSTAFWANFVLRLLALYNNYIIYYTKILDLVHFQLHQLIMLGFVKFYK